MRNDSIERYRENILKEGVRRTFSYSRSAKIAYDELSNFIYKKQFKKASDKMKSLHNKHLGERCFVIATGPSLNKTNLDLIKDEIKIGINTSFNTGLSFKYYMISDRVIWDVYSKKLLDLDTTLFLGYVASRHFFRDKTNENVYVIKGKNTSKLPEVFPSDISENVYVYAKTIVYLALQILYYLGFSEVYLIGCDCDFSGGHFDNQKFARTSKLQGIEEKEIKHWNSVFDAYRVCKKVFEQDGRKIINCTVGGKLEVFERKKLMDVIKNG